MQELSSMLARPPLSCLTSLCLAYRQVNGAANICGTEASWINDPDFDRGANATILAHRCFFFTNFGQVVHYQFQPRSRLSLSCRLATKVAYEEYDLIRLVLESFNMPPQGLAMPGQRRSNCGHSIPRASGFGTLVFHWLFILLTYHGLPDRCRFLDLRTL